MQPDHSPPRIERAALVADDDVIVRDVLRSLLTEAGYTVVCAANGQEALALAPHLDASVAILDLAMPNGDGLQTCAALRQLPDWQTVPILILTSFHTDTALRAARRAGVSDFVCKPFVPSELLQRVAGMTGEGTAPRPREPMVWRQSSPGDANLVERSASPTPWTPGGEQQIDPFGQQHAVLQVYRRLPATGTNAQCTSEGPDAPPQHRRILVAEDEKLTREIVSYVLRHEKYLVDVVTSGQEAVAAVVRGHYDLVLMDVRMPVVNGTDATRMIRSLPNRKRHTPVIAMTANAFKTFAQEMRAAGMNDYLMKPVSPEALLACVRQHLGGGRKAMPSHPDRPAQTLELDRLQDEGRLFAPGAMGRFLDNLAASVEEALLCVQGWVTTEPIDLHRRLHNLAGVAGTLGCAALSEVARDLEADPMPSDALRERFIETAHRTLTAVRQHRSARK